MTGTCTGVLHNSKLKGEATIAPLEKTQTLLPWVAYNFPRGGSTCVVALCPVNSSVEALLWKGHSFKREPQQAKDHGAQSHQYLLQEQPKNDVTSTHDIVMSLPQAPGFQVMPLIQLNDFLPPKWLLQNGKLICATSVAVAFLVPSINVSEITCFILPNVEYVVYEYIPFLLWLSQLSKWWNKKTRFIYQDKLPWWVATKERIVL